MCSSHPGRRPRTDEGPSALRVCGRAPWHQQSYEAPRRSVGTTTTHPKWKMQQRKQQQQQQQALYISGMPPLTAEELRHFNTEGYILRRGALSPTLLAAAQDAWWKALEHPNAPPRLQRDDQSTWRGELPGSDAGDPKMSWGKLGWRCRLVGDHPALLDLLPRAAFGLAEQLCGEGTLIYPTSGATNGAEPYAHPGANYASATLMGAPQTRPGHACRGVYCTLPPLGELAPGTTVRPRTDRGHVDGWEGQRWRLSASTYLQDVPPGGGGFCIWPGSHHLTWGLPMGMEGRISLEQPAPASMSDDGTRTTRKDAEASTGTAQFAAFNAAVEQINQSQPVEIYGSAGDLLLWHSRLVHAAPPNLGTEPISLRPNVIYDYYALPAWGLEDTPAADIARGDPPRIWDEWSDELRAAKPASVGGPRL